LMMEEMRFERKKMECAHIAEHAETDDCQGREEVRFIDFDRGDEKEDALVASPFVPNN
jgi:hypothetical protein